MVERIVDKIVNNLLENNAISQEEISIYKYGYTLLCEVILNIIIAIIIGSLSGKLFSLTLFLIIYIPLRSFCGGWHADKIWKCTIYSNLILVMMVLIDGRYSSNFKTIMEVLFFAVCLFMIFLLAPIDTKTKPISQKERIVYKKKIGIIMVIHICLLAIMLFLGYKNITYIFVFAYIIQFVMLVLEILNKKLEKLNI